MSRITKTVCGISFLLISVLLCVFVIDHIKAEDKAVLSPVQHESPIIQQVFLSQTASADVNKYLLRTNGSNVSVYLSGFDEPLLSLDIPTSKLRELDAEMLVNGIEIEGDEALWRMIEDFTS